MENIFKFKIDDTFAETYFNQCQHIVNTVSEFLSSKEIFYRTGVDKDGNFKVYLPVFKGTDTILAYGYQTYNNIMISDIEIGYMTPGNGYHENYGYPDSKLDPEEWFTKDIIGPSEFCTQRIMRVNIRNDGLSEDYGMSIGVDIHIQFPMYFCDFKKEENGFTVKVCTRETLIEKYPEIAENFCEELF